MQTNIICFPGPTNWVIPLPLFGHTMRLVFAMLHLPTFATMLLQTPVVTDPESSRFTMVWGEVPLVFILPQTWLLVIFQVHWASDSLMRWTALVSWLICHILPTQQPLKQFDTQRPPLFGPTLQLVLYITINGMYLTKCWNLSGGRKERTTLLSWYAFLLFRCIPVDAFVLKINFAPQFVANVGEATVQAVANHVEHIAQITEKIQ